MKNITLRGDLPGIRVELLRVPIVGEQVVITDNSVSDKERKLYDVTAVEHCIETPAYDSPRTPLPTATVYVKYLGSRA